jgi:phosphohistidine phosphatase
MRLYLLRHAAAAPQRPGESDTQRPLTPRGIARMRRCVGGMAAMGLEFDHILTSPLLRARQTADLVSRLLPDAPRPAICPPLGIGGAAAQVVAAVAALRPPARSVLLVGHEPDMGRLASLLNSGTPRASIRFGKAGLCCLDVSTVRAGLCAEMRWLLTGRMLRRMG